MSVDRSSSVGNGTRNNSNSNKPEELENSGFNRFRNQPRGSPPPDLNPTVRGPANDGGSGGDGNIGSRFARISGDSASRLHAEEEDESGSRWSGGGEEAVEGVDDLLVEPTEVVEDCYGGVDSDGGETDEKAQEEDYHQDGRLGAERAERWSPPAPANVHRPVAGFGNLGQVDAEDEEDGKEGGDKDGTKKDGTTDSANGYGADRGSNINTGGTQSRHFRPQPEDDAQGNEGPRLVCMESANDRPIFSGNSSADKVGGLARDGDIYNRDTHEPPMQLPQDDESPCLAMQQRQRSALQSTLSPGVSSLSPAPRQEPRLQQEQKQDQTQQQGQQQQQQQQRNSSDRKEDEEDEEAEAESRDITASNSDLLDLFGADGEVRSATTPSSSDVSALFGAGRGEEGGGAVDTSCDTAAVSSPHFDHSDSRRSSVAVSSIYSESDVDDGRDNSNHGSSRSFAVGEHSDLDGSLAMMRASSGVDGGGDEDGGGDGGEDEAWRQKREDRQAIFQRRVGDGFLRLANCYLTASSTIRGVEAEQREMLQEEENIQQGLVKFGKRVLEAAHTMETRLQAAFAGDDDSGMEEHMPPAAPLNQRGRTGKADDSRNTGEAGEPALDDRTQLATTPRADGIANSSAAGAAINAPKPRDGESGRGESEWRSTHPVETGAFGTFHDSHDDGERFSDGVVRGGRKFNSNLTGAGRNQGGPSTEEATSVGGSQNIRSISDMVLSVGSSGVSSRPSASYSKRPRFNEVGARQGM